MLNKKLLLVLICYLPFLNIEGQQISKADSTLSKNSSIAPAITKEVKQKDLADVVHGLSKKKKTDTATLNPNATNYHLSIVPAVGYTLQTGFAGILSGNIAYKTDKNPETKLSSITTSVTYSQYSQTILPLQADIWTKNNEYNLVSDNRFIDYPSSIYGLGGRTDPNKGVTIDFSGIKLHETILKRVKNDLYLGLGYYYDQFWNIKALDSLKRRDNARLNRELGKSETASGLAFKILFDNRLNQINASNGWFVNIVFRSNFTFLKSDNNWNSLLVDVRKYIQFPRHSKNVLGFWALNWMTVGGTPPYLLLPSTGWDDQYNTGRGYIQGRYRGNNMHYFETEYRYNITRNGLLGGVVFANFERFSSEISPQFNSFTPGYGMGLRIKLNKYSGANLCIDYGFGKDGSRGFFVNLGEVF